MNARIGVILLALPACLVAQAMVETAITTGRSASASAPAEKSGKAIGAAFENLNRTLESAKGASTKTEPSETGPAKSQAAKPPSTRPAASARAPKPAASKPQPAPADPQPEVTFEDPAGIRKGMDYAEIVRRFGPPSLTLTTGPGEETLLYAKKDVSIGATLHDGKVASVQ